LIGLTVSAQETRTPNDVYDLRLDAYAFTNATVYQDHLTIIQDATLLIKEGLVVSVTANGEVPSNYVEIDLAGRFVYPGLIDIYTQYGLPEPAKRKPRDYPSAENLHTGNNSAYNANEAIKSHYNAAEDLTVNSKAAKELRKLGFSSVLSFQNDGIARGTSSVITLGDDLINDAMLSSKAAAHYSFSKGSSNQSYPSSPMGVVSLLRQTFIDSEWYGSQTPRPFTDQSLDSWLATKSLPQIFEVANWKRALVADKVGDEFGVQYIIKGSGDEYQRLNLIKATDASFILPLTFPEVYDVDNPIDAKQVSLAEMKHWELASYNLSRLAEANIPFAITASGANKSFWKKLRLAIKHGLDKSTALAALTTVPADLIMQSSQIGSLKKGRLANFLITSGELFNKKTKIHENWIRGKKYELNDNGRDIKGSYQLLVSDKKHQVEISGETGSYKAKIIVTKVEKTDTVDDRSKNADKTKKDKDIKLNLKLDKELVQLNFIPEGKKLATRLSGWSVANGWKGSGELANGEMINWSLSYLGALPDKSKKEDEEDKNTDNEADKVGSVVYPFSAYGFENHPEQQDMLFKNATVWTSEDAGILQNTDVLVRRGKISKIGKNLRAKGVKEIDATGQHLTSGIIDEHSHTALDAWNEGETNSSMVRMIDVVDSEDINIYQNLAGGVTAAQLLHGSANPVGGQSALIKMRWGKSPEGLLINGADKYIKFALGENVKRTSNRNSIRYPQSRMGVEQVYMDAFGQARAYEKRLQAYANLSRSAKRKAVKPRRSLVHETMLEILNSERYITCHSYVQSEINMLMKVADHYDFTINTFTHILEGYKVADTMAEHGAGGSTFADWWAYKWETRYAIPYNAALMHRAGVVTAINSDSAEMARRLNQEAAKTIKYGGLSEEEAWKQVTLNPARLLHLDQRMGSIKVGKDADIVLWNENPLSIYAKVNKTVIDGTVYFDREQDLLARATIKAERTRLIHKMRTSKSTGKSKKSKPKGQKMRHLYHGNDVEKLNLNSAD